MFKYQNKYNIDNNNNKIQNILIDIQNSQTVNDFLNKNNSNHNKNKIDQFIKNNELDLEKYRNDYKKSIDLIHSTSKLNKNLLFSCIYINLINIDQLLEIFIQFFKDIN